MLGLPAPYRTPGQVCLTNSWAYDEDCLGDAKGDDQFNTIISPPFDQASTLG